MAFLEKLFCYDDRTDGIYERRKARGEVQDIATTHISLRQQVEEQKISIPPKKVEELKEKEDRHRVKQRRDKKLITAYEDYITYNITLQESRGKNCGKVRREYDPRKINL